MIAILGNGFSLLSVNLPGGFNLAGSVDVDFREISPMNNMSQFIHIASAVATATGDDFPSRKSSS
jgi:hypothetical protein